MSKRKKIKTVIWNIGTESKADEIDDELNYQMRRMYNLGYNVLSVTQCIIGNRIIYTILYDTDEG